MDESKKRKENPTGGGASRPVKLSKGGSNGAWRTPHHSAKLASQSRRNVEAGNIGIWVTCQRHKEGKAMGELTSMCNEHIQKLYGIEPPKEDGDENSDEDDGDIQASIQKELEGMKAPKKREDRIVEPIRIGLDCVIFLKTTSPVEPIQLVRSICEGAQGCTSQKERLSRFVNRFTPVTASGKATENGLEEVAKQTLASHFHLASEGGENAENAEKDTTEDGPTYAIRPTFRAHNKLTRNYVIEKVASMIGPQHKVNLTNPDKVILIDICQTICGMSVVDGDWESMKRFNLHEIYESALKKARDAAKSEKTETEQDTEHKEG